MISDKQSIAELFKNHFVRIAEGVTQLDTDWRTIVKILEITKA